MTSAAEQQHCADRVAETFMTQGLDGRAGILCLRSGMQTQEGDASPWNIEQWSDDLVHCGVTDSGGRTARRAHLFSECGVGNSFFRQVISAVCVTAAL